MQETPDDVRGVGAVPQSADRHDDDGVEHLAWHAISVASEEADVEVVPEKRGQRDVPTAPEILDTTGEVGVSKILGEAHAHHEGNTDGHIGVPREIEVNLEAVGEYRLPQ